MTGYIRVERQRARLTVTLDHQPTRNALTAPLAAELQTALDEAAADPTLQTLILRGANGSFCAGGGSEDGARPHGTTGASGRTGSRRRR